MENVTLEHAKEHLEELIERARRGEDVCITDAAGRAVRLTPEPPVPDVFAKRITDTMPPFAPLKEPRKPGRLAGILPPPPDDFFDPMSEEELKVWYGDDV
jgi:prevent-host-death family protein